MEEKLIVEGEVLTSAKVEELVAKGNEAYAPHLWDLYAFLQRWFAPSAQMTLHTSGSTGCPKEIVVEKERMRASARMTCHRLNLKAGDRALLCMNLRYIGAMMVVVRALVAGMELVVRPASGHPLRDLDEQVTFAAMVPLQVYHSLREEREKFSAIDKVIIGGGAVESELEADLRMLPNEVYSTYGMTETLSHIALRRLNGASASRGYRPLEGVQVGLSEESTLWIDAPAVCDHRLTTNDIAEMLGDGSFRIRGRRDNVVNSGGVKIQIEEVEAEIREAWIRQMASLEDAQQGQNSPNDRGKLQNRDASHDCATPPQFALTAIADTRLGEALTLLVEGEGQEKLWERLDLEKYHRPQRIFYVDRIPLTGNGKIDRVACRHLAKQKAESLE